MSKIMKRIGVAIMSLALGSSADVVFSTDFQSATQTGGAGNAIQMAGTTAPGVTVSSMTANPGTYVSNFIVGTSSSLTSMYAQIQAAYAPVDLTTAISSGTYFEFTLSSATALNLGEFSFSAMRNGFNMYGGVALYSSIDGYATALLTIESSTQGITPGSVDLSGIAGFDSVTNVTFRFYIASAFDTTTQTNRRIGIDDISISVVPEAGPVSLFIIGAIGTMTVRRVTGK